MTEVEFLPRAEGYDNNTVLRYHERLDISTKHNMQYEVQVYS